MKLTRLAVIAYLLSLFSILLGGCSDPNKDRYPLLNTEIMRHPEEYRALLNRGADVNQADQNGTQPIHRAAALGGHEIVEMLIAAGAKIDARDNRGRQPLIVAVDWGNVEATRALLSAGAKLDIFDPNGLQPIHIAAYKDESHIDLVRLLLTAGALPESLDKNGARPLHWAARKGSPKIAKLLLEAGAKVDATDNNGDQPLHWVARYGNFGNHGDTEIVRILRAFGANAETQNRRGETPAMLAKHIGPQVGDAPDMKGSLDEATFNFIDNNIYPILISAKMCRVPNGRDGCVGKDFLFCMQHNSLRCNMYGIDNEQVISELTQAFRDSGLRVSGVSFWRSSYKDKSIIEKPVFEYRGNL